MRADQLAEALGGRREGRGYMCRCPVHGGRSLKVTDADRVNPMIYCFGGCEFRELVSALRSMDLWEETEEDKPLKELTPEQKRRRKIQRNTSRALRIVREYNKLFESAYYVDLSRRDHLRWNRAVAFLRAHGEPVPGLPKFSSPAPTAGG